MRKYLGAALAALLVMLVPLAPSARAAATPLEGFVTSFDGTAIHYFLFLPEGADAGHPVPAVLRTHGWGGSGESSVAAGGTLDKLLQAGYAVLTWDQRGFGRSGGQAEVDSPDFEGKDVKALIDQVLVPRSDIAAEAPGDPILGMSGGSYAGGIQFVAAAIDPRIDAIAPEIAWHDLPGSLFPNNVPKLGWDTLLYGVGQSGLQGYVEQGTATRGMVTTLDPMIHEAYVTTAADNDPSDYAPWFAERSISNVVGAVDIPTLVIQGTIDTLFPMNQGIANFDAVRTNGAPVKLLLYNSGHTLGSSIPAGSGADSAGNRRDAATLAWFTRYLKGDTGADTGALVDYQLGDGTWASSSSWPPAGGGATFAGTASNLVVTPAPAGGGTITAGNPDRPEASARIPVLTAAADTTVLGVTHLSGTVTGVAPDAFLFFKLVDATTGQVIDDQVTPWRGQVLTGPVPFSVDLNGVSWKVPAGHTLALEVSTGSLMYSNSRVPGVVNVAVTGTLPVVGG